MIAPAWAHSEEPYHFIRVRTFFAETDAGAVDRLETQIRDSAFIINTNFGILGTWENQHLQSLSSDQVAQMKLHAADDYLGDPSAPPSLGNTQFDEPPLYYALLGFMQIPLHGASLETELAVARFGSLLMGLLTLWFVGQTARIAFPTSPHLHMSIPLAIAVLPAFTVVMTMVNNTALAVAVVALVIWRLACLMQLKSILNLVLLVLGGLLCLMAKSTSLIGWMAVAWGILWMLPPAGGMRLRSLAAAGAGLLLVLLMIVPSGARNWYLPQAEIVHQSSDSADGVHFVRLTQGVKLWQSLPLDIVTELRGHNVTSSGWLRTEIARSASPPEVWVAAQDQAYIRLTSETMIPTVAGQWMHYTDRLSIPAETRCMVILLKGGTDVSHIDALSLSVKQGTNAIANSSFEASWLTLRPAVERLIPARLAERQIYLSWRIAALLEIERQAEPMITALRYIFSTFWGWFGWATPGLSVPVIMVFALSCLFALIGVGRFSLNANTQPLARWFVVGCVMVGATSFLLTAASLEPPRLFAPCDTYQGRTMPAPYYLAPAVAPLLIGWVTGMTYCLPASARRAGAALLCGLLYMTGILSLLNIEIPTYLRVLGIY